LHRPQLPGTIRSVLDTFQKFVLMAFYVVKVTLTDEGLALLLAHALSGFCWTVGIVAGARSVVQELTPNA